MTLITRLAASASLAFVLATPALAQTSTALNGQIQWGDVVAELGEEVAILRRHPQQLGDDEGRELVRDVGDFSVAVAAFPELHPRSPDRATDRRHLAEKLAAAGRDSECRALAAAVRFHVEHRVFLNGARTVVFR